MWQVQWIRIRYTVPSSTSTIPIPIHYNVPSSTSTIPILIHYNMPSSTSTIPILIHYNVPSSTSTILLREQSVVSQSVSQSVPKSKNNVCSLCFSSLNAEQKHKEFMYFQFMESYLFPSTKTLQFTLRIVRSTTNTCKEREPCT